MSTGEEKQDLEKSKHKKRGLLFDPAPPKLKCLPDQNPLSPVLKIVYN